MKIKRFLSKISFAFALIGTLCGVMFLSNNNAITKTEGAYTVYNQIQNNLPQYLIFKNSSSSITTDKSIILMDHQGSLTLSIATDTVSVGENKTNYAYYPNSNTNTFFYFEFPSALSLYKDFTNQELTEGLEGQNLLFGQDITNYTKEHDDAFATQKPAFTPQQLEIIINLGTQFATDDNTITLTEGLYTIVIPMIIHYTDDNGLTFSSTPAQIEYTFMLFNSGTYFNTATGMQNVVLSNAEQVSITNSSSYSAYYYYNYNSNYLPKFTYDPYVYQMSINFTDYNQLSHYIKVEFNGNTFRFLDEKGQEIDNDYFIANYDSNLKQVNLTFNELGRYDFSFEYLYLVENSDKSQIFLLPFDALSQGTNSNIKNLGQRLYVYGYQATYTNHNAPIDPNTNQLTTAELKTISADGLSFDQSLTADITAGFENQIPNHSSTPFTFDKDNLALYIQNLTPVTTNQVPIKFLSNVNFNNSSCFYTVTTTNGNKILSASNPFTNESQNKAGEYLYVIQYTFNDYMGNGGVQQSAYYHYQLFYFKITNEVPSIKIVEKDDTSTYSSLDLTGFTNKSVYIINESTKSPYNANVSIKVTIYNYNTKTISKICNSLSEMAQYDSASFTYHENFESPDSELANKEVLEINAESANANRKYTIEFNTVMTTPNSKTFTIDTNDIVFLSPKTVANEISDNLYSLGNAINTISTNSPFVFRWESKNSGALTYGYVKQIPLTQIDFYNNNLTDVSYSTLLADIFSNKIVPVPYMIDFGTTSQSSWASITNTDEYASGTNIKSTNGLYILEVFDQAGNYGFSTMIFDGTEPMFIKRQTNDYGSIYSVLNSYDVLSASEDDIEISWGKFKAIILNNIDNINTINAIDTDIAYTVNNENANQTLRNLLQNYTDVTNTNISNNGAVTSIPDQIFNGGPYYNGTYLLVEIDEECLVRDIDEKYNTFKGDTYGIQIIGENTVEIKEGTYQFYITDNSNVHGNANILNYPSSKLSLTVTSDSSQTFIVYKNDDQEYEPLKTAGYSMSNIYYQKENGDMVKQPTSEETSEDGETTIEENTPLTDKTYKYMYYTPTNSSNRVLYVSYIPLSTNGLNISKIQSIKLQYYPYEVSSEGNCYYYNLSETPNEFTIFDLDKASGLIENQQEVFQLSLGTDEYPMNGRYVITRTYTSDSPASQYDYYERILTIDIDSSNLISQMQKQPDSNVWESFIGGDIVLNMYSGENQSGIQVSFPFDRNGNQTSNSFYNGEYTNDDEQVSLEIESISGNKLPMMLYIPQYKYTKYALFNEEDNSFSVTENNNLSYYGNAHIQQNKQGSYEVIVENVSVYGPTTEEDAKNYLANNLSIKQYKIYATIAYTPDGSKEPTIIYNTNGTTTNGYLNFYINDEPVNALYLPGKYVVTLYQAKDDGTSDNFYRFYKFRFDITSQQPNVDIVNQNTGIVLDKIGTNSYYTNSSALSINWEVPSDEYHAKIDENKENIKIYYYENTSSNIYSQIKDFKIDENGLERKIILNLDALNIDITKPNSKLHIEMQYEGYDQLYYNILSLDIFFDTKAPIENLDYLITNATYSIQDMISADYLKTNTRENYDYNNQSTSFDSSSYSYTVNTGMFRGYAYTVDKTFIDKLVKTLQNASVNNYGTQAIYYKPISDTNNYLATFAPTTKENFSTSFFYNLTTQSPTLTASTVYEIVEIDNAGNMVSYLINYIGDKTNSNDADNLNNSIALSYTNKNEENNTKKVYEVKNSQIANGSNIYSNTGFAITSLNYQQNPWGVYKIQLSGEKGYSYYMSSPALNSNQVYKITKPTPSEIVFSTFSTSQIINQSLQSSSSKHVLIFNDVLNGYSVQNYLTIMDTTLETQTVKNGQNNAILDISIPSASQIQSTTNGYIYPKKIEIQEFINNKWETFALASQEENNYGVWNFENQSEYITFTTYSLILRITVNVATNTKVKYIIEDNFGNTTTVIQIANEITFNEAIGSNYVYEIAESGNEITYLADSTFTYSFNNQLYKTKIYALNGNTFVEATPSLDYKQDDKLYGNNIVSLYFTSAGDNYDKVYKINLYELEDDTNIIKTIYVKLYNKLPKYNATGNATNTIKMIDKNGNTLVDGNIVRNQTVHFDDLTINTEATSFTTYSQNVTLSFTNGQLYNSSEYFYNSSLTYSVYISKNGGQTWENINANYDGYLISGTGNYQILVKYDSSNYFTSVCSLYYLTIVDSSSVYYYITVDDATVEKSSVYYTNEENKTFESTYIVSVNYNDKDIRFNIAWNEDEELNLVSTKPIAYPVDDGVYVEEYSYNSKTSSGSFAVIFIPEEDNFLSTLNYEDSFGSTTEISGNSITVYSSKTQTSFEKLKINFKSYYGIETNKINVEVYKYFNGTYTKVDSTIYKGNNEFTSYIYLEKSGSYRIAFKDSCSPANVQMFGNNEYLSVIFLNEVPFIITYQDGEEIITSERVQKAVYNSPVTISLYNLSTYFKPSDYPVISVKKDGVDYKISSSNYTYKFTESGYYSVKFSATTLSNVELREVEYNFTIINPNESKYAYSFSDYKDYYIKQVLKDGVDITQNLLNISNFDTITINNKQYLAQLTLSYGDEKTGAGKYTITICSNQENYQNILKNDFTFDVWINSAVPPINVSIGEGETTSDTIYVTINIKNFYESLGDSYIIVGKNRYNINADTISSYQEIQSFAINDVGTWYIQVYSDSGNLLYSYKVYKTAPLNAFSIIAIIIGVIVLVIIIIITIKLRKRQRAK